MLATYANRHHGLIVLTADHVHVVVNYVIRGIYVLQHRSPVLWHRPYSSAVSHSHAKRWLSWCKSWIK